METVAGVVLWVVIILLVVGYRSERKKRPKPPPRPQAARHPAKAPGAGPVAGWMIGHAVAHDRTGFPGDPLPHGHLGSPANLAFWGGLTSDPDEEDAEDEEI